MSPRVEDGAWAGDPLPRGRHKLPREAVRASQRERLLKAMAELVGEQGYEATSVPKVIAVARVSSNTFYSFFADKTDCFIALCEQLGDELFQQLLSFSGEAAELEDALAGLDRGIRAYLRWWSDRPALARAYFGELPSAGPRAIEERERQYERFEAILRTIAARARALHPETPPLREVELRCGSIVARELVADQVRAGRVEQLEQIEGELRYMLIKLLVGDQAARQRLPSSLPRSMRSSAKRGRPPKPAR